MIPPPDNPDIMPQIPGYRITRVIGYGGMSTVYQGMQISLSREVAIKVMRTDVLADEVSRRRFENEARTIARLEHPHIVNIYEVGRTNEGQPWYSMPYLSRGHLGQRDLTHDQVRIRQILEALLSALAFAHARGVIHRDVKAENVLFDETGRPLLADFGIALRRGHGTRVTLTGLAIGSTAYMAPEQARGQQVDMRADLYSMGVLAWEMLTGALPYQADDAVAMAVAHVQTPLPRLPPKFRYWQRFMNQALAKQPQKRFHNAEHMLTVLREVPQSGGTHPPHWYWLAETAIDLARTHRALAWSGLAAVSVVAIGLFLSLTSPQGGPAIPPTPPRSEMVPPVSQVVTPNKVIPPAPENPIEADTAVISTSQPPPPPPALPLRTAPTSPASQLLEQIPSLLTDQSPSLPHIRQAIDLLLAAHTADSEHLQLPTVRDTLLHTLGMQVVDAIEDGDDAHAQALLRQLSRIRTALGLPQVMQNTLHAVIHTAISHKLYSTQDVAIARRGLKTARLAGLSSKKLAALSTRVHALEPPPGWFSVRLGDRLIHLDTTPVSRAAYARFVTATGRPAAICRERASPLRIFAPRDWAHPGFAQSGNDPVVCISWQDAIDYATWLSQRDGRHYRLPSMVEAATLSAGAGTTNPAPRRALSEWRSNCDADCSRRIASGRSWRSHLTLRPLPSERGYHDVGFRLAIDPPIISPSMQVPANLSKLNQQ